MGGHRRVKRTFHKGQVLQLTITDMAFGGKGIARVDTEKGPFVVFVQNAFPGQTVNAQVVKCKSKHAECRLLNVIEPASFEVDLPYQAIPWRAIRHCAPGPSTRMEGQDSTGFVQENR